MTKKMILISGMPGTGKSSFAKWLSSKLRIPLVCYDHIKEKTLTIARESVESEEQVNSLWRFASGMFYFFMEEIMKTSSPFIAEYFFTNKDEELKALIEKHRYTTITVHMDSSVETAHRRFHERNKVEPGVEGMRPKEIPLDRFAEGVQQNKDFRYGRNFICVDTEDFSKISYDEIVEQIQQYMTE